MYFNPRLSLKVLGICVFVALSVSVWAQETQRYICKDNHTENFFSFIPPEGWHAVNVDDIRGNGGNKIFRLSSWLNATPQGGTVTTVCHQVDNSNTQQPLIFICRAYNLDGTGTELEGKWLTERHQKKRQKERL